MKDLETINYVESEKGNSFQWGSNDCNIFILKYLDTVWGRDLLKEAYKKYNDKESAVEFQGEYTHTISKAIIKTGATRIPPSFARMGDILVIDFGIYELCHLCLGNSFASVPEDGKTEITRLDDLKAFDWALRIN